MGAPYAPTTPSLVAIHPLAPTRPFQSFFACLKGLQEGPGLLAMQVAPFVNDAAPSRPVWFAAEVSYRAD